MPPELPTIDDVPAPLVAVVIPAYRVAEQIAAVVARMPESVSHIIVVNDASPDQLASVLAGIQDPRMTVLTHPVNRGVGGAMKTGLAHARTLGADIVVKIDGDGQMDPVLLPRFLAPLVDGRADVAKGNRFYDLDAVRGMPPVRRFGNLALSFLVKMASGYWHAFDPCNGYIAVSGPLLRSLKLERLEERYFFEISLLCEMYHSRAVLEDVPMLPVYGDEPSSLNPIGSIGHFLPRLVQRTWRRVAMTYFMRDFTVVSVFLVGGLPLLLFGIAWSAYHWLLSIRSHVVASTGTVVIGLLAITMGFQLLLQAIVLDVANEPRRLS